MKFKMNELAYCGIYCPQCSFRVAAETHERIHLMNMPKKYEKNYIKAFSECECEGCKGGNICGECKVKDCAVKNKVLHCAECKQFPCKLLIEFSSDGVPHHHAALINLEVIREQGIDDWFEKFQTKLHCACGKKSSWYCSCSEHESSRQSDVI